ADPHVVEEHAGPGDLLQEVDDALPLPPAVEEGGGGAQIHGKGAEGDEVAGDPLQLHGDDPEVLGPGRHLKPQQLLDGQGKGELVVDGRQVVAAVGVGNDLGVGELLRVLLEAAVEVPDVRVDVDDPLAVDPGLQPEHAVGAGVLGPHADV